MLTVRTDYLWTPAGVWRRPGPSAKDSAHGVGGESLLRSKVVLGEVLAGTSLEDGADVDRGTASGRSLAIGKKLLAGSWVIVEPLENGQGLRVQTDSVGSLHVYQAERGICCKIGTRFSELSESSHGKLDWEGLAGFFGLGFFPGDRTFYRDIRILRPASVYEFDAAGRKVSERRYWEWFHRPDERRSEEDTIAEFGAVLREVLADQTREGRVALPLSGGLDSRTVAACLPEGVKPFSYGYGYTEDSIEIRIARQVAEAAGLRFRGHVIRRYLFDRLDLVAGATECFQDITQARQADVADWLGDEADFVLAAHWGDVFCDDMGFPKPEGSEEEVLDHSLQKMQKKGRRWLLDELVRPHLGGDPEEVIREMMRAELRRIPPFDDPDFRVKVFKTEQWAFRWTLASLRMYEAAAFPRIPFLDPRMVEFFCTVPTRMVRGRRLQIEYLKRHAPRFARIEWQPYEASLYAYRWSPLWMKPVRAWRKLKRAARGEKPIQRNWEVQFFSPGQWERLEEILLKKGSVLHEFVAPGKVRALLDEFREKPDGANGYTVSMLLTFAVWLEKIHQ